MTSSPVDIPVVPPKTRRARYTSRACFDCHQRKVKCSGEDTCLNCRNRDVLCVYLPKSDQDGPRKRRRRIKSASTSAATDEKSTPEQQQILETSVPEKDSEVVTLQKRVQALEQEFKKAQKQSSDFGSQAFTSTPHRAFRADPFPLTGHFASRLPSVAPPPAHFEQEFRTFDIDQLPGNSLSLTSQLRAMRNICRPDSPLDTPMKVSTSTTFTLIPPSQLKHLLGVYFRDFDSYFPMLERRETESRIFQALMRMGYREHNHTIRVDSDYYPLVALLFAMLGMACCFNHDDTIGIDCIEFRWILYGFGRKALQKVPDLDILRYHVITSAFMLHNEYLTKASHSLLEAFDLAIALKLNDQTKWAECNETEKLARQKIWWTMYFLDRRVGQKMGKAYFIRESEICVPEFAPELGLAPSQICQVKTPEEDSRGLSTTQEYFQILINLGKIWGYIWDTFFRAGASALGNWQEIEIADTRILMIQRQLPAHLKWETSSIHNYFASGEGEPLTRRRVTIFIRLSLLRMLIRQNPLAAPKRVEDIYFCAKLAACIINAVAAFSDMYTCSAAHGYIVTGSLVECMYHLVHYWREQSDAGSDAEDTILQSFQTAFRLLEELSARSVSARQAITLLKDQVLDGSSLRDLLPSPRALPIAKGDDLSIDFSESDEYLDWSSFGAFGMDDMQSQPVLGPGAHAVLELAKWDLGDAQWLDSEMTGFAMPTAEVVDFANFKDFAADVGADWNLSPS